MLFHKRLAIILCGLMICGGAGAALADFPWNPFAKKTDSKAQTSSSDPFSAFSPRSGQSKPTGQAITEATRRMIVDESRNYPASQRSQFIAKFARLNDAQARQQLNQIQIARIDRQRAQGGGLASTRASGSSGLRSNAYNDFLADPPSNAAMNQAAQSNTWRQAPIGTASVRPTNSTGYPLPEASRTRTVDNGPSTRPAMSGGSRGASTWAEQDAGYAQTRSSQTASYLNPFAQNGTGGDRNLQPSDYRSNDQSYGYAHTEGFTRQEHPSYGVNQQLTRNGREQLPMIRPAGAADSNPIATSERDFAGHYQPVAATMGQDADPRQFNRNAFQQTPVPSQADLPSRAADLNALIARAEDDVRNSIPGRTEADHQRHVTRHVELRLLYLVSGQRDRALTPIPGVREEEQAFWTRVFWGLATYLDAEQYPDRGERTTVALEQMRAAILALQGQANLSIRKAAFCTDIVSFGDYTTFESDAFSPGQEVLIYSELENYRSERTDQGQFRTVLKSAVELFPAGADRPVDQVPYNETTDLCNSTRRDFIQGYRYRLPQQLAPGAYVLRLTVEDKLGGKSASYSLNLTVH